MANPFVRWLSSAGLAAEEDPAPVTPARPPDMAAGGTGSPGAAASAERIRDLEAQLVRAHSSLTEERLRVMQLQAQLETPSPVRLSIGASEAGAHEPDLQAPLQPPQEASDAVSTPMAAAAPTTSHDAATTPTPTSRSSSAAAAASASASASRAPSLLATTPAGPSGTQTPTPITDVRARPVSSSRSAERLRSASVIKVVPEASRLLRAVPHITASGARIKLRRNERLAIVLQCAARQMLARRKANALLEVQFRAAALQRAWQRAEHERWLDAQYAAAVACSAARQIQRVARRRMEQTFLVEQCRAVLPKLSRAVRLRPLGIEAGVWRNRFVFVTRTALCYQRLHPPHRGGSGGAPTAAISWIDAPRRSFATRRL